MFSRQNQAASIASSEPATLTVGEHTLPIVKTQRKKSIGIKANGQTLELHVPKHLSERALRKVLDSHRDWIHKRLYAFESKPQTNFQFQPNEQLDFLGESFVFLPSACMHSKQIKITCETAQFKLTVPEAEWLATELNTLLTPVISSWYTKQEIGRASCRERV